MDEAVDLTGFVRLSDDGVRRLDLAIEGVTCAACIGDIERAMSALEGVGGARLNYSSSRLALHWRDESFSPSRAVERLRVMGYKAHPFEQAGPEAYEAAQMQMLVRCLAVAGFAAMNVMLLSVSVWAGNASDITPETRDMFHWISALIAIPAAAFSGRPFFNSAAQSLKRGALNMDVPISLGIILALGMSVVETARHAHHAYFDSALMLIFFLLTGRCMEQAMRRRTRMAAGNLAALRAPMAVRIMPDGALVQVPTARLAIGDLVLIAPGERAPADGVTVAGASEIDESIVTGETRRRVIGPGAMIYAGILNHSGALRVRVSAKAENSLLSEIERLLDKAGAEKSDYVGLAERASRIYAPVVHVTALATMIGWLIAGASFHDAVIIAIAVLIITCPCALALAVPAVHVTVSGALFKAGVLLNGGHAIERLAEVDHIVFDKTGTLTTPEPRVNAAALDPDLLEIAARLARTSRHPLARALAEASPRGAPFDDAQEISGQGVRALIDGQETRLGNAEFCGVAAASIDSESQTASHIYFRQGERTACLAFRQTLRPDALRTCEKLGALGYPIEILSGDNARAVQETAEALKIPQWRSGVRPVDKVARLAELKAQGRRALMVGDGLNDAPALAGAHVSMSPISAADLTQAAADAVFLGEAIAPVEQALRLSRLARRLMRENLWIAVVYNAIAVPLAIAGLVTPLIAALAMSGSSLIVTANALRARGSGRIFGYGDAGAPLNASGKAASAKAEVAA